VNLNSLDLNLVLALRALLEERNVTRAGQRIGLSQPAMSAALARLRRHFDDELLARPAGQYELTALGRALLDRAATACDMLERVFSSHADFEPANADHEFTILGSDYAATIFGAELARTVHAEAPGIRLRFRRVPGDVTEDAATLLSTADGMFMPHGIISGFPAVDLFTDRWVFVVARENPEVADRLALADLARLPWVTYQRTYDSPAVRQLAMIGIEPRVEASVDTFHVLPFLVAGTSRIALMPASLAVRLADVAGVRVLDAPYGVVPLQEAMWWHPVHTYDAAHIWLRETAARVGTGITGTGMGLGADAGGVRTDSLQPGP